MSMLSFKQVSQLVKAIGHKRTIIVEGENGIGKTGLFYALANDPHFANHIHVKPIDCTQLSDGSVWMPDIDREMGVSRELPNERFGVNRDNQRGINGSRPALIFLDEIAKAKQFIKDVLAPIVYERRVGNYELPENSVVFCATNLGVEGLGDNIQAHLRNRLVFVKMRKPTQKEWREWALDKGIAPEVIAWTDELEDQLFDSFLDYQDGGKYHGQNQEGHNTHIFNPAIAQTSYVTPRSLHAASDIVYEKDHVDEDSLMASLAGTIGTSSAESLHAFIKFGEQTEPYSRIVSDPSKCPVPSNPVAQIITVLKCITQTNTREQAESVCIYVKRMRKEMQSMFCNNLAQSSRVTNFVTVTEFQSMLQDNKIYFTGK
jgi:hypothetical protein